MVIRNNLIIAFKDLISKKKFCDITVSQICEQTQVNRKTFYRYFKDKYDLVSCIFKEEFISLNIGEDRNFSEIFKNMVRYFYDNVKLYKKLFTVIEQNSFCETLHEFLSSILAKNSALNFFKQQEQKVFAVKFFSDALVLSIRNWIAQDVPLAPEEYFDNLASIFVPIIRKINP